MAPPTISQREMIRTMAGVLGREIEVPSSELEARFLIDGLVGEERRLKRGPAPAHVPSQDSAS